MITEEQLRERGFKPNHSGAGSPFSIKGMTIIRLQCDTFWTIQVEGNHKEELNTVDELDTYMTEHSQYFNEQDANDKFYAA